jgi:hypothetical protein
VRINKGNAMAYFSPTDDAAQRGGKVAADIVCALLLLAFSVVFFGYLGGVVAFILLEAALLGVDLLMPTEADARGGTVR